MSMKFLPFITNESKPATIFASVIKRAKGYSDSDIANVYSAILHHGVDEIRTALHTSNSSENTTTAFNFILRAYSEYTIKVKELHFWECYLNLFGLDNLSTGKNLYTNNEIVVMFASIAKYSSRNLKEINFNEDIRDILQLSYPHYDFPIKDIKNFNIEEKGEKVSFNCIEELKAFIAYSSKHDKKTYLPVFCKYPSNPDNPINYPFSGLISLYNIIDHYQKEDTEDEIPF